MPGPPEDFDPEDSPVSTPWMRRRVGKTLGQDTAVAEYLRVLPRSHRIDEGEDHESLGTDVEVSREVPEQAAEFTDAVPVVDRRRNLSR